MSRLLIASAIIFIAHSSCPPGFELVRDGECRGLYTTIDSWWDEQAPIVAAKCAEIQAKPHQSYWRKQADLRNLKEVVLGLVCNVTSKQWQWADGSPVDYKPMDNYFVGGCGHVNSNNSTEVFCTTQLEQPIPNPDGCDGFLDESADGVCYQVGANAMSWQEAQKICKGFGANLASIHNSRENSFVRRLAVSNGAVNGVFLGATLAGKGNEFEWIDGTEWDYDNFYPGFPIDGLGDCVALDTSTSAGQWQNFDCSVELPVACIRDEREISAPTCSGGPWKEGTVITSPGFPFSASTPCDFFLSVKSGMKVQVDIIFLEANSCCDSLVLYDGNVGGHVIAKLTGEMHNATFTTSTSNVMKVSWQPMGGVNVQGMMITFRAVD